MPAANKQRAGPQRVNFHMIPLVVETGGLSLPAYRLYGFLKAELQERPDSLEASYRSLASKLSMDHNTIRRAQMELVEKELIEISRGHRGIGVFKLREIWHKNHKPHHQMHMPTVSPETQSAPPPTVSPETHSVSPETHSVSPETHSQIQNGPIDTKILDTKNVGGSKNRRIGPIKKDGNDDVTIETFRERMAAAENGRDRVDVLVQVVRAYTRNPPANAGDRAAGLLKRYSDPAYVLQAVAYACIQPRAGDVFNYAEGILRNRGRNNGRATRVEPTVDLERWGRGWFEDGDPRNNPARDNGPAKGTAGGGSAPPTPLLAV